MRLTDRMKRVVTEQSLAFVATVRPDGTPRSPRKQIDVDRAQELVSPAYDDGADEDDIAARWRQRHLDLDVARRSAARTSGV